MSSSYQRYHPDNDNPAPGLLATGALAAGGLSAIALMNDGTLLKDLNKKGRDKNIDNLANYSKEKAAEAEVIRKQIVTKLKSVGIDASKFGKEQLDALATQLFNKSKTGGVQVGDLKSRMAGAYDRNINKIRGRRG